jgi:3-hydroxypropanoate dehydrogenase
MTEWHENYALDKIAQDLLFRDARTANTFADEPVGEEQVAAIYDLIKYAPTAFNSQPLRILLVPVSVSSSTCGTATGPRR